MTARPKTWTWLLVLVACWVPTQSQQACNFGSGSGCKFPCRCAGGAPCDELTGQCPDDRCLANLPDDFPSGAPEAGWEGPGCQTGNSAYNRSAWQYGQYSDWSADRAVDGVVDRRHCPHPAGPGLAWWTVDLGALYTVYRVTVANTLGSWHYTRNLRVFVSNSSLPKHVVKNDAVVLNSEEDIQSYGDFIICGNFTGVVGEGEDAKVTCGQPLVGRYVLVWKYQSEDEPTGSFQPCEVTVVGHKYSACDGCVTDCNHVYGCIADCPAGKNQTTFCGQDCADGYYGVNCRHACSATCNSSCRSVDGKCNGGCQDWWIGDTCDREIGAVPTTDLSLAISATTTDSVSLRWSRLSGVAQGLESHYGYVIMLLGPSNQWEDAAWVNYTQANIVAFTLSDLRNKTWCLMRLEAYRQARPLVERVNVSTLVLVASLAADAVTAGETPSLLSAVVALGVLLGLAVIAIIIIAVRLQAAKTNTPTTPEITDLTTSSVPMTTADLKASSVPMTTPDLKASSVPMTTSDLKASSVPITTPDLKTSSIPMETSAWNRDNLGSPNEKPEGQYEVMGHVTSVPRPYASLQGQTDLKASSVPMTTPDLKTSSIPMETSAWNGDNPGSRNETPEGQYEVMGHVTSDPRPYASLQGQTPVYENVNQ